ncbi:hypothetical protein AS594_07090 [Streptomyces agglomeratus]|uniref:Uncharacterized protein n=1 Tax=Streptomyces agglomeratus TaxID=285458 RepID=A0A1E5P483_9ACTN|nr:hypothetical protein [Streptomyces agglomeratus]OEJ24287.1 hypothetical protein AS594_07090 [Streptomyces agglomeratus]
MPLIGKKPAPGEFDALKAYFGGSNGGSTGDGSVYMGQIPAVVGRNTKHLSPAAEARLSRQKKDLFVSTDEALADFYNWNTKKQTDFLAQGIIGGQLKLGDGPLEAGKLWAKLVKEAALYGAAGKKVRPLDLMAAYVSAAGGTGERWVRQGDFEVNSVTGERRYVGPRFKTQTDTRVDLTDPDTARAIATKLFQDMMGRDPGAGELGGFAKALHSAEAQSPVTQVSTTEFDMSTGEPLGTKTNSSGGMTAEGRAYIGEQQIKKKKEYGALQAVTTYQGALEDLIYGAPE